MNKLADKLNDNKRTTRSQGKTSQVITKKLDISKAKVNKTNVTETISYSYISIQYETEEDGSTKDTAENVLLKLRNKLADALSENQNLYSKIKKYKKEIEALNHKLKNSNTIVLNLKETIDKLAKKSTFYTTSTQTEHEGIASNSVSCQTDKSAKSVSNAKCQTVPVINEKICKVIYTKLPLLLSIFYFFFVLYLPFIYLYFFFCCVKYIQSKKKFFSSNFFLSQKFFLIFFILFFIFFIAVLNTVKVKKKFFSSNFFQSQNFFYFFFFILIFFYCC